jgi:hypothetical protein
MDSSYCKSANDLHHQRPKDLPRQRRRASCRLVNAMVM